MVLLLAGSVGNFDTFSIIGLLYYHCLSNAIYNINNISNAILFSLPIAISNAVRKLGALATMFCPVAVGSCPLDDKRGIQSIVEYHLAPSMPVGYSTGLCLWLVPTIFNVM